MGLSAGLGQIAREIGVSRNAVIGKINRLGLSRPKDVIGSQLEQRRAARLARPKTARTWRPKHPRLNIFAQHEMLMGALPRPQPRAEDIPIYNGRGCTLLELSQGKCRWPISNPGAEDFCFCGNEPVKGLPYFVLWINSISMPSRLKKPSSTAAIATKYEGESRSGTHIRYM
jgi:GcrA cell cycle regulator